MLQPFQCLLISSRPLGEPVDVIIAASGSSIYSFSASDGSILSSWPQALKINSTSATSVTNPDAKTTFQEHSLEPSAKRRKLSASEDISDSSSAEIVVENGRRKGRKPRDKGKAIPAVIKIVGTSDGKHLVAVTGGDKCIRVFRLLENGSLKQLSQRNMPKRPCSVILTTDESTILCADKFGDVYALPFFESKSIQPLLADKVITSDEGLEDVPKHTQYFPSANSLTVHTKRNQQALKNQQNISNKIAEKKEVEFNHQLLLGHVSLLTDLAYVTITTEESTSQRSRSYILTSDRDEHIRISRGLPQAHIIENYCLGHTEFVSKLCIIPWSSEILVSGGGDNYLLVWDWMNGKEVQRLELKTAVEDFQTSYSNKVENGEEAAQFGRQDGNGADRTGKIAVSGIWAFRSTEHSTESYSGQLIVTCEGIPALFVYDLDCQNKMRFQGHLVAEGNILDVAILHGQNTILYTMDHVHRPFSTTVKNDGEFRPRPALGMYRYMTDSRLWTQEKGVEGAISTINRWLIMQGDDALLKFSEHTGLSELLYGVENLRKRGGDEQT